MVIDQKKEREKEKNGDDGRLRYGMEDMIEDFVE